MSGEPKTTDSSDGSASGTSRPEVEPDLAALSPSELRSFAQTREFRRASAQRHSTELKEVQERQFGIEEVRSQQRHRYMVLAAGALALFVPLLERVGAVPSPALMTAGAALLLTHIILGVVLDATAQKRRAPLVMALHEDIAAQIRVEMIEDVQLALALHEGQHIPSHAEELRQAREARKTAAINLARVGSRVNGVSDGLLWAFFAALVLGLGTLVLSLKPWRTETVHGEAKGSAVVPSIRPASQAKEH